MTTVLSSAAEQEAKKAEGLPAFGGLNLLHIKRQVAHLLELIGRGGIFEQYTSHNISHVDEMLRQLDWLIPEQTRKVMSPADWLMTVLATYFHDLGMLVTQTEYNSRNLSHFQKFRDETLFAGPNGEDYRAQVLILGEESAERFFYQEFVRYKHAERIKAWVMGQAKDHLGIAHEAVSAVHDLLIPLGQHFRRDLGLVCESHHLNDLADLKKYKPAQPYGNSDLETVNLQYAAVLLRTTDLLHVTSDRTPSIVFRTVSPTDPISQQEWAKQMAVKRIRAKAGIDKDGFPDEKAVKDTVEVHAFFTREDGFFGLTSYLSYVADQLKRSNEWITSTVKLKLAPHEFPWRKIDDSNIETEGFIRDTFEFTIDQAKVLDLLTGHTLYNNTNVVIRELVQNSLDAVRLQSYPKRSTNTGKVEIHWDSKARLLSVRDNGTGMTQQMINKFLLTVGSSRYQDPEFKKSHPQFSSISRFGIGVLSAFMIADTVDILTCHSEEEQARKLTLRSVHGKYLIRLLDKANEAVREVGEHGTVFQLRIRPSVEMPDVVQALKRWIVVPDCQVTATVDGGTPTIIGFASPREMLATQLTDWGISVDHDVTTAEPLTAPDRKLVRVIERTRRGVTIAYAVEWDSYFREWCFLRPSGNAPSAEGDEVDVWTGTCIEGVRVEFSSPGFSGRTTVAVANVVGPDSPKTNVARSGLEGTQERDRMLIDIYALYGMHAADEMRALHEERQFSLTWASGETRHILRPIVEVDRESSNTSLPVSSILLENSLRELPILVVERNGHREVCSAVELLSRPELWTIDSGLLRSAELLIREVKSEASLRTLIGALGIQNVDFPEVVLCSAMPLEPLGKVVFAGKEVDRIVIHPEERRVDLRWVERRSAARWRELSRGREDGMLRELFIERRRRKGRRILIGCEGVQLKVPSDTVAVGSLGMLFILPGTEIASQIKKWSEVSEDPARSNQERLGASTICDLLVSAITSPWKIPDPEKYMREQFEFSAEFISLDRGYWTDLLKSVDVRPLVEAIGRKGEVFDTSAWMRSETYG